MGLKRVDKTKHAHTHTHTHTHTHMKLKDACSLEEKLWSTYTARVCVCVCVCVSLQSCLTLCGPMDYSLPVSSVHGILQVRILQWVAMPPSRGSSWLRDQIWVSCGSCIAGRFFTTEPPGKLIYIYKILWIYRVLKESITLLEFLITCMIQ